MREKRIFTSPSAIQVKNWQNTTSIDKKLDVISRLGKDEKTADICCNVRLTYSSVRIICDHADRITESAKSGTEVSVRQDYYIPI
jgi:hypothetical protein